MASLVSRKIQRYGWKPDLPDQRDFMYAAPFHILGALPNAVDMTGLCPPVYDQGNLGCHDAATEVLTDTGWTPWSKVMTGRQLLGTMNQATGLLEFQAPVAVQAFEYDGPVYQADHQSLDFALTPSHRMYVRPWDQGAKSLSSSYRFTTIDSIGWYAGLPHATSGHRGVDLSALTVGQRVWAGDDFLALIALVASDGWVGGTESNWNSVSFCCFRDDRQPAVREFAKRLGIPEVPSRPGVWKWADPDLAAWFRANAFTGPGYSSPFKRVPDIVKSASSEQILRFLQFFGDQHVNKRDGVRQFYTSSERMADDLQELLLRTGRRGSLYRRDPRSTKMRDGRRIEAANCAADITISEFKTDRLSLERKRNIKTDHYKGAVYCATVPNSLLVTRRNGSILISGNSCTANAIAGALEFDRDKQKLADFVPSRLFIYYNERVIENSVDSDSGAQIRDGIRSVNAAGACEENIWPYDESQFAQKPPDPAYTDARLDRAISYARVMQTSQQMMGCLASGFPFVFGFTVYASFESDAVAASGIVPMPRHHEQIVGGHAVLAVGYDALKQQFIVRNSWGSGWGLAGYFRMPFAYLTNPRLASDIWTIRAVG